MMTQNLKTVVVAGTFGVRGREFAFIKRLLEERGVRPYMIHTGLHKPLFKPDVDNGELARLAGDNLQQLLDSGDQHRAVAAIYAGLRKVVLRLQAVGELDGMLSLGGSSDTAAITAVMRLLPIGVPKLMVTTVASGTVKDYVETSDILLMPSIVNADGLDRISRQVYVNAVNAIAGMVLHRPAPEKSTRPTVAISVFSLTSDCVSEAKRYLEERGYDVLEFSCTGAGGRTMEKFINEGAIAGVLDLTTTEWCDELLGGMLGAGPTRLDAAIACRVPQVVSIGATDMVNFGPVSSVPMRYARRNLYRHNANVTLMRTTAVECARVGDVLADKWNNTHSPMVVLLPAGGVSALDAPGQPFDDPDARNAIIGALQEHIYNPKVKIEVMPLHINDPRFAHHAAQLLIDLMEKKKS